MAFWRLTPARAGSSLALCLAAASAWASVGTAEPPRTVSQIDARTAVPAAAFEDSEDADVAAQWVRVHGDNHGLPFVIVDKRRAQIHVYAPGGEPMGASTVLLGQAVGDAALSRRVQRPPSSLLPQERTTPSGRYASEPGHNDTGEDIVWIDYDAALAIHRLRASPASQRRVERMNSPHSDDKRISSGCIVVPVAFYDAVLLPSLGRQPGVVYVLPETRSVREAFAQDRLSLEVAAAP